MVYRVQNGQDSPCGDCCTGGGACCLANEVALSAELIFDTITPDSGSATAVNVLRVPITGSGGSSSTTFVFSGSFTACGKTWCYAISITFGVVCGEWAGGAAGPNDRSDGPWASVYVARADSAGHCFYAFETPGCGGLDVTPSFAHGTPGVCAGTVCTTLGPFPLDDPDLHDTTGTTNPLSCAPLTQPVTCSLGNYSVRVCFSNDATTDIVGGAPSDSWGDSWGGGAGGVPTGVGPTTCDCPRVVPCPTPPCGDDGGDDGSVPGGPPGDAVTGLTTCCERGEAVSTTLHFAVVATGGSVCFENTGGLTWSNGFKVWFGSGIVCGAFVTYAVLCSGGVWTLKIWINGALAVSIAGDYATSTGNCSPLDLLWTFDLTAVPAAFGVATGVFEIHVWEDPDA